MGLSHVVWAWGQARGRSLGRAGLASHGIPGVSPRCPQALTPAFPKPNLLTSHLGPDGTQLPVTLGSESHPLLPVPSRPLTAKPCQLCLLTDLGSSAACPCAAGPWPWPRPPPGPSCPLPCLLPSASQPWGAHRVLPPSPEPCCGPRYLPTAPCDPLCPVLRLLGFRRPLPLPPWLCAAVLPS